LSPAPLPANVTVQVPARLHLGFLDLDGGLGRRFGSIGLAINGPKTSITISAAPQMRLTGPERERVGAHVETMRCALGLAGAYDVRINEVVPAHAGLGSGTQLALSVAAALRRLHGLPLDVARDALRLGRGARSGVGIGLFERGGLVVDGGRGPAGTAAPIVSRMPFPEPWRVLLVLDPYRQGVHGPDERDIFSKLPPFSDRAAGHLCRLVLMQALPALAEGDIVAFGTAVKDIQGCIGDYFAPLQGGSRFSSPDVAAALDLLEREGAVGIGQSSWGPTGFAFASDPDHAEFLAQRARAEREVEIQVCRARDHGAEICEEDDV
jgi:beta-ribofuranosylaminobenzene 5'-phosphate synthase